MKNVLRAILVAIAVVFINYSANSQSFNYSTADGNLGTTYSWIDCSTGTEIQNSDWLQDQGLGDKKDDGYAEIAWPFNFQFYDSYYFAGDKMYLCTNGFIRFDDIPNDDASDTYNNSINSYSPNLGEIVSLAMEDAGLESVNSNAYYKTTGSAPNRIFTVELNNLEIRFNQNKYVDVQVSFYETSNKIVIKVGSFDVASANSTYIGIHSGNTSYKDQWGELHSIGANKWRAYTAPVKSFSSLAVTQASTDDVFPSENNEILRLEFDIDGGSGAFDLSYMQITPLNTNNNDVSNVKLFHTTEAVFSTDHQIGGSVTLTGGKYTFSSLGYNMPGGTSYVWITYDIVDAATSGNKVDAKIKKNKITLNGLTYPTAVESPTGRRKIKYVEWVGTSSTDWNTNNNWSNNTVPKNSTNVIIPSGPSNQPHVKSGKKAKCKNLTIKSGATLTYDSGINWAKIYGSIYNDGTITNNSNYIVDLFAANGVIEGGGDFTMAKFELWGDGEVYTLKNNISLHTFVLYDDGGGSTLNVGDFTLTCSNDLTQNSGTTLNIDNGEVVVEGAVTLDGTLNPGTGTFYYAGDNSQGIINKTYYNLKVKLNSGTRTLTNVSNNMENLELTGTGTAALNAAIDIDGSFTMGAGGTLDQNGYNINLSGNWTNNGVAAISGSNTVTIDGIGSSHIYGATSFYDLTINKSTGDVYASGTNHITHTLTLTKGIVYSASNTAVIVDAGATLSGGGTTSYVDGPLRKDGNTAFTFPVGDFRRYAPCSIGAPSASTQFVAEYHESEHSNTSSFNSPLTKVSLKEYWTLTPSSSVTADVTLTWQDGSWSGIGSLSDLRMAHYNGSSWDELSGATTSGNTSSGSITVNSVNSFSPFTFGTIDNITNPLPIELLSFDAEVIDAEVFVGWKTASEKDNDYFIVERSKDGIYAERVGILPGAGNSNAVLSYEIIDNQPYTGVSYYRLTQVDYNGQSETFDWVAVHIDAKKEASVDVYPNPLTYGSLNLNMHNITGNTQIIIYDFSGRVVYKEIKNIENDNQHLQLHLDLAKGAYNVQIVNEQQNVVKRLIVN